MGFIHRDVKPANCLIKKGIHKLADFGFATKVDIAGRHFLKEVIIISKYIVCRYSTVYGTIIIRT